MDKFIVLLSNSRNDWEIVRKNVGLTQDDSGPVCFDGSNGDRLQPADEAFSLPLRRQVLCFLGAITDAEKNTARVLELINGAQNAGFVRIDVGIHDGQSKNVRTMVNLAQLVHERGIVGEYSTTGYGKVVGTWCEQTSSKAGDGKAPPLEEILAMIHERPWSDLHRMVSERLAHLYTNWWSGLRTYVEVGRGRPISGDQLIKLSRFFSRQQSYGLERYCQSLQRLYPKKSLPELEQIFYKAAAFRTRAQKGKGTTLEDVARAAMLQLTSLEPTASQATGRCIWRLMALLDQDLDISHDDIWRLFDIDIAPSSVEIEGLTCLRKLLLDADKQYQSVVAASQGVGFPPSDTQIDALHLACSALAIDEWYEKVNAEFHKLAECLKKHLAANIA